MNQIDILDNIYSKDEILDMYFLLKNELDEFKKKEYDYLLD